MTRLMHIYKLVSEILKVHSLICLKAPKQIKIQHVIKEWFGCFQVIILKWCTFSSMSQNEWQCLDEKMWMAWFNTSMIWGSTWLTRFGLRLWFVNLKVLFVLCKSIVLFTLFLKVHRIPPLYSNGGELMLVKDNHDNWADINPYVSLQLTIASSLGKEAL